LHHETRFNGFSTKAAGFSVIPTLLPAGLETIRDEEVGAEECHATRRLRRTKNHTNRTRATSVTSKPITAPSKNRNGSGGGLEFSGVGGGAKAQTASAPSAQAKPIPTAKVITASIRPHRHFIEPEYASGRAGRYSGMSPDGHADR